jgi:hypothetical protein
LAAFTAALAAVREQLGRDYPLIIGGEAVPGSGEIVSTNPARTWTSAWNAECC